MATVFMAKLKSENFDKFSDKIAVVIKEFTLKKKADGIFQKYSEPYIVSLAIDESGANDPSIELNVLPFPNVRKGDTIEFNGQGHIIYGPNNPGEFIAYSVLFMESDQDIRNLGKSIESIMKSEAVKLGAKALLKAVPTYGTAVNILTELTSFIAKKMVENKDDELYRRNGSLLRDVKPPFDILRTYTGENDYIRSHISIIPLSASNKLGQSSKKVKL